MRRLPSVLADVLLWATAVVGGLALVASLVLFGMGCRPVIVRSGSMEPTYPVRSVAIVRKVSTASIRVGDVVAVRLPSGERVMHRVWTRTTIGPGLESVSLKGDANDKPDEAPVALTATTYKALTALPGVGGLATQLHSPVTGFVLAGALLGPAALRRRRAGSVGVPPVAAPA